MLRNNKKALFSFVTICGTILIVGQIVYAMNQEPGSTEDPLVSLSYVEQKIAEVKLYVDEKIKTTPVATTGGDSLEVVNLKAGEKIIAGQGTELILRSGTAIAITSPGGGLSNVTVGVDIGKGEKLPKNHLLIIPRADGRGAEAQTAVVFMVRGTYRIE